MNAEHATMVRVQVNGTVGVLQAFALATSRRFAGTNQPEHPGGWCTATCPAQAS